MQRGRPGRRDDERMPANIASPKLFLCGDVMTGRGIDQALPHPGAPRLYESYVRSAKGYVELAEARSGTFARPVDFDYLWGDLLAELRREAPDARIVNLETAVTAADDAWPGKPIHYRMHPANVPCLTAAGVDCCVLANNHVLDWGYAGLAETLSTLRAAGVRTAGAGANEAEALSPAALDAGFGRRVLVFAFGMASAGVPRAWSAGPDRPGVAWLADLSAAACDAVVERIHAARRPGDLVVVSIHWGGNWGHDIPAAQREFAHRLVDRGGVDVVHGHSSHHPKAIDVYRDRLVLYGCGDLVNDYEGIGGYEAFRPDLALAYLPRLDAASGRLLALRCIPLRMRRFRLGRATRDDADWLLGALNRESRRFGTRLVHASDGALELAWDGRSGDAAPGRSPR
jgi:poly-gamma-glutamate synthesis protein (capsule biosynthesis protein)